MRERKLISGILKPNGRTIYIMIRMNSCGSWLDATSIHLSSIALDIIMIHLLKTKQHCLKSDDAL